MPTDTFWVSDFEICISDFWITNAQLLMCTKSIPKPTYSKVWSPSSLRNEQKTLTCIAKGKRPGHETLMSSLGTLGGMVPGTKGKSHRKSDKCSRYQRQDDLIVRQSWRKPSIAVDPIWGTPWLSLSYIRTHSFALWQVFRNSLAPCKVSENKAYLCAQHCLLRYKKSWF